MSKLLDSYKELTDDQKAALGKGSSRISEGGAHLVSIDSIKGYGDETLTVVFSDAGKTVEADFSLLNFDTKEFEPKWAMDNLTQIANALGLEVGTLLKSEKPEGTAKKYGEEVAVTDYSKFNGEKLHIFTKTEISGDEDDVAKVWVNQRLVSSMYFSADKKDPIAQSTGTEANTDIFDIADTEAKENIYISMKKGGKYLKSKVCIAKLASLQEKAGIVAKTAIPPSSPTNPNEL